jgi:hypothetical protein
MIDDKSSDFLSSDDHLLGRSPGCRIQENVIVPLPGRVHSHDPIERVGRSW